MIMPQAHFKQSLFSKTVDAVLSAGELVRKKIIRSISFASIAMQTDGAKEISAHVP